MPLSVLSSGVQKLIIITIICKLIVLMRISVSGNCGQVVFAVNEYQAVS